MIDPLGGVGTVAFEAALLGRVAVSNDKSPFPALVAAAKLDPPARPEAQEALERLAEEIAGITLTSSDLAAAEFGLNARVADYYHPDTLEEILKARKVFLETGWGGRGSRFVWASLLHILHGNRPYALSRTSHPLTPYAPTGPVIQKSVVEYVGRRLERAFSEPLPAAFRPGSGTQSDFRTIARMSHKFDAVITSPPFEGMRFDRPNWLRLWFCGWGAEDFHQTSKEFLEREQIQSFDCYQDFFGVAHSLVRPGGVVVVHVRSGLAAR